VPLFSALLLLGVLLFLFPFTSGYAADNLPLGLALWSMWTTASADSPDYSYCLLVPILVAFLVYAQRSQLARAPIKSSSAAIGWVLLGLLFFWIGSRAGKQYLGEVGIQLILLGLILWFFGGAVFRRVWFAWVFIAFMLPMPFVEAYVGSAMREIVSALAGHLLNLLGVPCIHRGTALLSAPNLAAGLDVGARFQIDVADPCSGLHSLFPLLMFSAIYSYLFVPGRWQQWTVFLSAFPLILVGNVVRVFLLVVGCITLGVPVALGTNDKPSFYHEGCGIAVFVIVLGLEWLLAYTLIAKVRRRIEAVTPPGGDRAAREMEASVSVPAVEASGEGVSSWRAGLIVGLAVAVVMVYAVTPNLYLPSEAGVMMSLPDQFALPGLSDELIGTPAPVSDAELTFLPKDTEFARKTYEDDHGHSIFFSIVLSGLQQYTIHPPEICLPAQGWTIGKKEDMTIRLASGRDLTVRCLHLHGEVASGSQEGSPVDALYLYWFVTDGLTTPSYLMRNVWSSWDRIWNNRDHRWAYITVMSPITKSLRPDGLDEVQTKEMLEKFIVEAVPSVQKGEVTARTAP